MKVCLHRKCFFKKNPTILQTDRRSMPPGHQGLEKNFSKYNFGSGSLFLEISLVVEFVAYVDFVVCLWNTSVLWEQNSVIYVFSTLFLLKYQVVCFLCQERPDPIDKLNYKPNDCFSKALSVQFFSLQDFLEQIWLESALKCSCAVVILLYFYCASFSFMLLVVLKPIVSNFCCTSCVAVPLF